MEASLARGYRDNPRLPTLSLGLSSVRHIVNKIEAEYSRAVATESEICDLVKYEPNADEGCEGYHDSLLDTSRSAVWNRFVLNLGLALRRCIPSVSFRSFGVLALVTGYFAPRMISYLVIYPFCRLVFGTLYPAYASYKAVRTKNLKEYVKWMMYWIVFALFTCTETFTDVFLSWFPFYYEVKIVLVLWLLSPATKGSSILYRKFVHPALCRREQEIDEYIAKAKDQGYHTVLNLGTKGVNYATTVIMQTAIKGGGGLVQQLRKSYSLSDLSECDVREERTADEADDVLTEPRLIRRVAKSVYNTRRSASECNTRSPMYFPEVDADLRSNRSSRADEPDFSHIKSTEDISSGYSSADNSASLTRAGSLNAAARAKARTARTAVTTIKRPQAAEENEVIIEELHDDDTFDYANMPALVNLPSHLYLSNTDPPFIYQYVGDQVKIIQVLGNFPINVDSNNETNNPDQWDQKETINIDISPATETKTDDECKIDHVHTTETPITDTSIKQPINKEEAVMSTNFAESILITENKSEIIAETEYEDNNVQTDVSHVIRDELDNKQASEIISETASIDECAGSIEKEADNAFNDRIDPSSLDVSSNHDSAESDDEASFGTPDNSPKSKRKSPKGKYGKGKAPPPPKVEQSDIPGNEASLETIILDSPVSTSLESLTDIVNKLPNTGFKETGKFKGLHVINPISEHKMRHKSKSPKRVSKGSSSGIGKLLQLPSKLAFWNKTDDKQKDNASNSSGDLSRRSSTNEKTISEFQSCSNLDTIKTVDDKILSDEMADDQFSFKDATDFENEAISHDIMEKSDALQRLIEAKLDSHPEYKIVSLHEEIVTTSKSTDV